MKNIFVAMERNKKKKVDIPLSFIPWFGPEIGKTEQKLVIKVLESGYINDGEVTRIFEKKVAEFLGVKHCVAVTSGTAALSLALMGLGIGPKDEVIVPDLTFIATANAVGLAGAKVKLVDIEPHRFAIDVEKVKEALTRRTCAIIPVDVNGRGANYQELLPLAKEKGLFVVCDATEALGSKYNGRYLGTFGDAGCFSFSPNKIITTGQGGMIATNNTQLSYRLRELKDQGRLTQGTGGDDLHPVIGYNFKFTDLQAAIGLAQLERLPERLEKAKLRDSWYRSLLGNCSHNEFPQTHIEQGEILQWTDILVKERLKLVKAFKRANIGFRAFWHPLHTQRPYACKINRFINSINISKRGLWLPSHFSLTKEQVKRIASVIRDTFLK